MSEPLFLTLDEVVRIHRDQLDRYGGPAGIRDLGLLQSALAMPSAGFGDQYAHEDLWAMAAAYVFHIVQNHPFVDGNKRVGLVAALAFLGLNGSWVEADPDDLATLVWGVARGEVGKAEVAEYLRLRGRPYEDSAARS
jgi:death-on-curing protein